jgi:hypothetical protein
VLARSGRQNVTLWLLASTVAASPLYAPEGLERFHLEWDVRPGTSATAEGYVYNKTDMEAERMQVGIEQLDVAGNVVGQTTTWCSATYRPATGPSFGRACRKRRAPGVTVLSFNWLSKISGN